jgi:hypothetical protein
MSVTGSLRCPWVGTAILIGSLILIDLSLPGQAGRGQVLEPDARELAKMIDEVANRNPAPKLLEVDHPRLPGRVPLFPDNYDWKEVSRVWSALRKLRMDTTPELWEELIRKSGDPRYALTFADKGGRPVIWTVGRFCDDIAYDRLVDVFVQHLPEDDRGRTIPLEVGIGSSWVAWRQKRAGKTLDQLQMEVCEQAVKELDKVKGVSKKEKDLARKKIMTEIDKLKKTKKPVFLEYHPRERDTYPPEQAKRVREILREVHK